MNFFSVALMILVIAAAIVKKPGSVRLSQSLMSAIAQVRLIDPAEPLPAQDNLKVTEAAGVWKVLVANELASTGQAVNAGLIASVISIERVAAMEEDVPPQNTNRSVFVATDWDNDTGIQADRVWNQPK